MKKKRKHDCKTKAFNFLDNEFDFKITCYLYGYHEK